MANSVRQNILSEIVTILETLVTLKHVELKHVSPVDLDTVSLPCAFVFGGADKKLNDERALIGCENWLWRIVIEVWVKDVDPEDILKEIHDVMWTNRDIGGYAITSDRVGVDLLVVDVEQSIEALLIDYDILYRHERGQM